MIALALAATPLLGALTPQEPPATGCAAYLWSATDRRLVAMASADPARLRLVLDGKPIDLPRVAERGGGGYGLAGSADYRAGDVAATLDLTVVTRADLRDGAEVPQASLSVAVAGGDGLVVPLAGLIGCKR